MNKIISILLIIILTLSLVACTADPTPDKDIGQEDPIDNIGQDNPVNEEEPIKEDETIDENNDNGQGNDEDNNKDEVVIPPATDKSQEVTLYFANKKYVETGNEELEHLMPEDRTIQYGDISLEEAIVKELIKGPQSAELTNIIPSTAKLLGVEVSDATAFVNFAREGMNGGSLQESLTIESIVQSLVELNNIKRVQFLIDGEKAESLMGHFEITNPFE